jgi:DNA-binding NtrC family response regulator
LIAATNKRLDVEIDRELSRRLVLSTQCHSFELPPLRERLEDVPLLVRLFQPELFEGIWQTAKTIHADRLKDLQNYSWPGNVRELRNTIEQL